MSILRPWHSVVKARWVQGSGDWGVWGDCMVADFLGGVNTEGTEICHYECAERVSCVMRRFRLYIAQTLFCELHHESPC